MSWWQRGFLRGTLVWRLLLAVLPIPAALALLLYATLVVWQGQRFFQQEQSRAQVLAQSLADNCLFALQVNSPELMQTSLNSLFLSPEVNWIEVVDPGGKILAHSDPSQIGHRTSDSQSQLDEVQAEASMRLQQQSLGRVRLGLSLGNLRLAEAQCRNRLLQFLLASVLASALLVTALSIRLTRPLTRLAGLARQIADGNLALEEVHQRMAEEGSRTRRRSDGMLELRTLSRAFLQLSQRMSQEMEEERTQLASLEEQVNQLLRFQEAIASGDSGAQPFGLVDEELMTLARGLQEMSQTLGRNANSEAQYREELEQFNRALHETRGLLEETDRYKNEFLGVVSHELRTPLTSVQAFAEILLDYPPDVAEERREFVSIIYRESDRLTQIINHLLDISRIESKRMRWKLQLTNLVHLLEEQISGLPTGIPVEVELAFSSGGYQLWLDSQKVGEAIEAVLRNAVQHSPPGGSVQVSLGGHGEGVEISIADRGPGVPPELQEIIFSKFQKVRLGDQPRQATGLSLALARAVIEAHQGRLTLDPDYSEGARFLIWLPMGAPQT